MSQIYLIIVNNDNYKIVAKKVPDKNEPARKIEYKDILVITNSTYVQAYVDAFAEKVVLLMKDENLRREMGENARRSAAKYDIDIVGQQWKQLFDELMENR